MDTPNPNDLVGAVRVAARRVRARLFTRKPEAVLQPERLYLYLDALWKRRDLPGAVVEIGCYRGGTSLLASRFLRRSGFPRRYIAYDTFGGFVADQFHADVKLGTPGDFRRHFADNSLALVRRSLDRYDGKEIELVQGDIATLPDSALPDQIAVALVDVDLDIPVHRALERVLPRMVKGGIIFVDDCPENYSWAGARVGYTRFVDAMHLPERYSMGLGIIEL